MTKEHQFEALEQVVRGPGPYGYRMYCKCGRYVTDFVGSPAVAMQQLKQHINEITTNVITGDEDGQQEN